MRTLRERIEIDLEKFDASMGKIKGAKLNGQEQMIVDLSVMYAQDSRSWLDKGDLDTSFSSISYAHGLLDAVLKIKKIIE